MRDDRPGIKDRIFAALDGREVIELAKGAGADPELHDGRDFGRPVPGRLPPARGFESRLQEVDPGRFQVVARLPGRGGGRSLMQNGHLDVDPVADGWVRDPWTPMIEGDRFHGAGVFNMKAGVAAMVMAAVAARAWWRGSSESSRAASAPSTSSGRASGPTWSSSPSRTAREHPDQAHRGGGVRDPSNLPDLPLHLVGGREHHGRGRVGSSSPTSARCSSTCASRRR